MTLVCSDCFTPVARTGDMHPCFGEWKFAMYTQDNQILINESALKLRAKPLPCTCHPDDAPPKCPYLYAASECQAEWFNASQPPKPFQPYVVNGWAADEPCIKVGDTITIAGVHKAPQRGFFPVGLVFFASIVGVAALAIYLARLLFESWHCL